MVSSPVGFDTAFWRGFPDVLKDVGNNSPNDSVISLMTWIFSSTALSTSNLTYYSQITVFSLDLIKHCEDGVYVAQAFWLDEHVMSHLVRRRQSRTLIRMIWYICPCWFIEILSVSIKENVLVCCTSPFYVYLWAVHWNLHILTSMVCLTSWSAVLEKVIVYQLVKKFPDFCGTQSFITVFARASHLSLSWDKCVWSTAFHHLSWILIFILFSQLYLGLERSLFPSGFPTKILYVLHFSFIPPSCSAHLILYHLYKTCRWSSPTLLQLHLTSSHLAANAATQPAVLTHCHYSSAVTVTVQVLQPYTTAGKITVANI